ncbi:hypothetical protein fugu_002643, partial [Takifugu bimaculatus]
SASERVGPSNYTEPPPPARQHRRHCHSPFDAQREGIVARRLLLLCSLPHHLERITLDFSFAYFDGDARGENGAALKRKDASLATSPLGPLFRITPNGRCAALLTPPPTAMEACQA